MRRLTTILLTSSFLFLFCAAVALGQTEAVRNRIPYEEQKAAQSMNWKPVMVYHGGPILAGPTELYIVYYGSFTPVQHHILDTFLENVGGSKAFNVMTEYYDSQEQYVSNALDYSPATNSYDDAYSLGKTLSGNHFETAILASAVAGGHLPSDASGIYILTISPDVKLPYNVWCAYHAYSPEIIPGEQVTYAVAADPPVGILGQCSGNIANYHDSVSPNFDMGVDSLADSLIHEFAETVTDPFIDAWFTFTGAEVGDVCNFNYGPTYITPNGSHANQRFGDRDYLVQQLWSRENPVGCVQSH